MAAEPITVRPIQQLHSTLPATYRRPQSSSARTNSHDHQTPISSSRSAILSASIRPVDGRHPHLLPSPSTVSHKPAADHPPSCPKHHNPAATIHPSPIKAAASSSMPPPADLPPPAMDST
ncbi:hypothetical protein ACLOJK_037620 [Asimina triloba]